LRYLTTALRCLPGLLLAVAAGAVRADSLAFPQSPEPAAAVSATPAKGESMQSVERRFGAPAQRHAAVGGDSPRHPPITRWDYPGFAVVFENSHVVTAVIPGRPPEIYNSDQLEPAAQYAQ
jgi:hypothetical protein